MKITLEKASGRSKCRCDKCKRLPEYVDEKGIIKKDSTCAAIKTDSCSGSHVSFYCRDCINILYEDIRLILNPKLWIFH